MERTWFILGALLAATAVASGAFAAHGLKDRLSPDDLDTFQIAARYHMYHALALIAVSYAAGRFVGGLVTAAGWLFVAGILLFSGPLYVLAVSGIKLLGAVAPIGGTCFLAGWACLALAVWRSQRGDLPPCGPSL